MEPSARPDPERVAAALAGVDADLDAVDDALRRLDEGTYGRCDACGEPIDDGWLAAHPAARTCADHSAH